jgi:cell wall-associated NlpC family hydrolase
MRLVRLTFTLFLAGAVAGCASSGARPKPFPGSSGTLDAPAVEKVSPGRIDPAAIVKEALSLRGVPYRNGGSTPKGFDCSGLVQYVFAQHGVSLPRDTATQAQLGREVRLAGVAAGDLIFFATTAKEPSHVGVVIGGDEFVHAPATKGVVRVERFSDPYWARRIVTIRRIE